MQQRSGHGHFVCRLSRKVLTARRRERTVCMYIGVTLLLIIIVNAAREDPNLIP